ncbi:MAG TPA: ABC transporter substrate-binding protein [Armatimonadota bacterium]|jgi:multiple sugar transport system substrate-binding protein
MERSPGSAKSLGSRFRLAAAKPYNGTVIARLLRPVRFLLSALALSAVAGCARAPERPFIELWIVDWNQDTRDLLDKRIIPEFERQEHVDVRVQYVDWGHLDEKLTISFAGGVQPDVFQLGAEYVGSMAYRGQAECLDRYVKDWPQRTDFIPSAWSTVVADGHVYGIPYLSAPRALVYRKDLFRKLKLRYPPTGWDEWAHDGMRLAERNPRGGLTRAGINLSSGVNWTTFCTLLWQNGGDVLTPDGHHAAFNSPQGVEALQFLVDLFNKYQVCPREGLPSTAVGVPLFASGQSAQELNNQFAIKNVLKYSKDFGVRDVGVALPPYRRKKVVTVWTDWLAISSSSRKKELAWKLVQHLTRPDNMIQYNETQYFLPPIKSAVSSDYMRNTPFMLDYLRLMEAYGKSLPPIPEWFEIRAGLKNAVDSAVYGVKTPQQALDDYARQVDALIAQRERTQ